MRDRTGGLLGRGLQPLRREHLRHRAGGRALAAAVEAAHAGPVQLVLSARAENYVHGRPDLAGTIARLQAFQEAGADPLFAPGVLRLGELRSLVSSVDRPVNVLALAACPSVAELASVGVA